MPLENTRTEKLTFTVMSEGYYEMIQHAADRQTVDEWIEKVALIWDLHHKTREPIAILTKNTTGTMPPLNYSFKQGMKLVKKYPNLPASRTAWVMEKGMLLNMMDTFLRMMPLEIEHRYFDLGKDDEAIEWLMHLVNIAKTNPSRNAVMDAAIKTQPTRK